MTRRSDYHPGGFGRGDSDPVIALMRMVKDSDPDRIKIECKGVQGGTYAASTDITGAMDLILELDRAITAVAERSMFTHPAYERLVRYRRGGS